ncbi:Uncharacterised protein [Bordetella pertussis]|nr:Uncharacterised protein [Bordetella pertussis]CFL98068.1 Uncharacterised protein [Bordetella pertussis]CFN55468.1 Uncharacterised protein [Bordetella pertussis]CFP14166.1 Uncharacterised protein [Bordetella pertussis]CFP45381.1 Uncharacterised protein [Bordetella pertussis]
MAAARQGRVDGAGDGEHFAAAFAGQPRGDERAALARRLDHQDAARQARHQAVAARKMVALGARAQGQFADQRAVLDDAVRQVAVRGGVDAVDAGAHHGHRAGALLAGQQRAFVGRRVDAQGQAADDAPALAGQVAREGACVVLPAGRGVARAHHRHGGPAQAGGVAVDVQQDGRVGDGQQLLRIGGVGQGQDVVAGLLGPLQRLFDQRRGLVGQWRAQLARDVLRHVARQRGAALGVDLLGHAQRGQQRIGGGGTDAGFLRQAQPGGEFGAGVRERHGVRKKSDGRSVACVRGVRGRMRDFAATLGCCRAAMARPGRPGPRATRRRNPSPCA